MGLCTCKLQGGILHVVRLLLLIVLLTAQSHADIWQTKTPVQAQDDVAYWLAKQATESITYYKDTTILARWKNFLDIASPTDPRVADAHFNIAVLYTKLHQYQNAVTAYDKLISQWGPGTSTSEEASWIANRAETLMLLGKIELAVTQFELANFMAPSNSNMMGLAVAFDRYGDASAALELVKKVDIESFKQDLARGQIFFEPRSEIYYYLGLVHEASGNKKAAHMHFSRLAKSPRILHYDKAIARHLK